MPNVQVDGTLNVQGDVFIPSGATLSGVVEKVTSTDNAVVRFDGTTGKVQNSGVVIDDNGNVGIGVTPSADYKLYTTPNYTGSANIGTVAIGASGANYGSIGYNFRTTGTSYNYLYNVNNLASMIRFDSGGFNFLTAPSGTAGNAITWTNAMTLRANGNLLVGTTIDNGVDKLQVNGSITSKSSQYKYIDLNNANTVDEKVIVDNYCLNIPVNDYGYVTIQVATPYTYCMQTFVCLNSPVRLFIRVLAGGTWSPWAEK